MHPIEAGPDDHDRAMLGSSIRYARENKKLSMERFSELAGIGRTTLHRIERTGHRINPWSLARALWALDLTSEHYCPSCPNPSGHRCSGT